jgi:hypothetical protein
VLIFKFTFPDSTKTLSSKLILENLKYEKMNWYNGFMEGFSCISNTVTYLSTPIEDSTLLKNKFMAFYLINMKSQGSLKQYIILKQKLLFQ